MAKPACLEKSSAAFRQKSIRKAAPQAGQIGPGMTRNGSFGRRRNDWIGRESPAPESAFGERARQGHRRTLARKAAV
ncbi:hypothetical protein A9O63_01090 [Cereibacter johrii]|nr:hypothetical protein A9O63_01090 [Cereibacter johrii]